MKITRIICDTELMEEKVLYTDGKEELFSYIWFYLV